MAEYRTGDHHGVTIVREGTQHHADDCGCTSDYTDPWCKKGTEDQLVAVVVNGDQALAERICALLNGVDAYAYACLGCGKRYRTADAAAECDAEHRAHAERIRAKRGDR